MADTPHLQLLQWDTDFFGVGIGRLNEYGVTPEAIVEIEGSA